MHLFSRQSHDPKSEIQFSTGAQRLCSGIQMDVEGHSVEVLMPKVQLLCTAVLNQISETNIWVKQKNIAIFFFCFARQREPQRDPALKSCVSQPGGFDEKFYSNSSRVGSLT